MDIEFNLETETQENVFAKLSDVKIFMSEQYDKFNLSEFNRDPSHYKNVMESIKNNDYTRYQPILVNKELEIVDGQNRFLACQELGLPIHFIVSEDIKIFAAAEINQASKNWSSMDYTRHYAKRGRKPYIQILDLCHKYNQSLSIVLMFAKYSDGIQGITKLVKSGSFEFRDDIDIDGFFEHMKVFEDYYDFSKKEKFVKAVAKFYTHPNYNHTTMINKLRLASGVVKEQPRLDMMVEELKKLYNYNNRKPISFS